MQARVREGKKAEILVCWCIIKEEVKISVVVYCSYRSTHLRAHSMTGAGDELGPSLQQRLFSTAILLFPQYLQYLRRSRSQSRTTVVIHHLGPAGDVSRDVLKTFSRCAE